MTFEEWADGKAVYQMNSRDIWNAAVEAERESCAALQTNSIAYLGILMSINTALARGIAASQILDENSPILDAIRDAIPHIVVGASRP